MALSWVNDICYDLCIYYFILLRRALLSPWTLPNTLRKFSRRSGGGYFHEKRNNIVYQHKYVDPLRRQHKIATGELE